MTSNVRAPPVIDFSPFYGDDPARKDDLVKQVRQACTEKGFFQITNHGVPEELQAAVFGQSRDFFSQPLEKKVVLDRTKNPNRLGYEGFRSQKFEGSSGDLKEGLFIGRVLPEDHHYIKEKRLQCGHNVYPDSVQDPALFKDVVTQYHDALSSVAQAILKVIAQTLYLDEDWFAPFCEDPAAVLRLLHYPSQAPDAGDDERGIGAHTDFGGITILLQDSVGGLQVYDEPTSTWIDVIPTPGALVVNLGDLMARWTNDVYVSNVHRVINKTGQERYSMPFFFTGNLDLVVKCIPQCSHPDLGAKYPPIKVEDWIVSCQKRTFGVKGVEGLSSTAATTDLKEISSSSAARGFGRTFGSAPPTTDPIPAAATATAADTDPAVKDPFNFAAPSSSTADATAVA